MNNKLFYFLILSFISCLEASEKQKVISDKKIEVGLHSTDVRKTDYEIISIQDPLIAPYALNNTIKKSFNAVEISEWFESTRIAGVVTEKGRRAATGIDITIFIKEKKIPCFEKKIKEYCDRYKKKNRALGGAAVLFSDKNDSSYIISLCLSKNQVEQIIKEKSVTSTSIASIVLAGLGVMGIIAVLVYYFNLHEKQMPWLQHR